MTYTNENGISITDPSWDEAGLFPQSIPEQAVNLARAIYARCRDLCRDPHDAPDCLPEWIVREFELGERAVVENTGGGIYVAWIFEDAYDRDAYLAGHLSTDCIVIGASWDSVVIYHLPEGTDYDEWPFEEQGAEAFLVGAIGDCPRARPGARARD